MSERDARDPYLGINDHIRRQARSQVPPHYTIGRVLSAAPLLVRADGMNLDKSDLKVALHLVPDVDYGLQFFSVEVEPDVFEHVAVTTDDGTALVSGRFRGAAHARFQSPLLQAGDEVLLIPSTDGQTYYLVEKLVEVDA